VKRLLIGLVALNAVLLVLGIGRGGDAECRADVCVGLVFDVGGLGDKSFNDAAYEGLLRAKSELGVGIRYIEPGDGSDRESALRDLARDHDLVIGVGFIFTDDMRKLAREFPGTRFAAVDYSTEPDEVLPDNLLGLRFREHQGSFLVGAIAGLVSETGKVGFVGGMQIPLIRKFEAGYAAGVKHVCPRCEVLAAYAGTEPKAFADPAMGRELAAAQINRGADVVFHASGKTGTGVFQAVEEAGVRAIGVDADQYPDLPCCMLTSMVKRVDVAVYEAIASAVRGDFEGGVREFGIGDVGVGFVYDDNNRDRIPSPIIERVEGLAAAIARGDIEVPQR